RSMRNLRSTFTFFAAFFLTIFFLMGIAFSLLSSRGRSRSPLRTWSLARSGRQGCRCSSCRGTPGTACSRGKRARRRDACAPSSGSDSAGKPRSVQLLAVLHVVDEVDEALTDRDEAIGEIDIELGSGDRRVGHLLKHRVELAVGVVRLGGNLVHHVPDVLVREVLVVAHEPTLPSPNTDRNSQSQHATVRS